MLREKEHRATNGLAFLMGGLVVLVVSVFGLINAARADRPGMAAAWVIVLGLSSLGFGGLFTVNPNEGRVLTLFGRYIGTVREAGLWFANPFYAKKRISSG